MAFQISRLYDFQPGTKALSGQVDSEFNQLVDAHNDFDSAVDTFLATLASVNGAKEIGAKGGKTLDKAVLSDNIPYVRLNADKVIETSIDGVTWEATGSAGHLVVKPDGTVMAQRSRLKFNNTVITDSPATNETIIQGITGPQGIQGEQGIQGQQGEPTTVNGISAVNGNITLKSEDILYDETTSVREQINNLANESTMPHQFIDLSTGKIYRYGRQVSADGIPQIISEEVI